MVRDFPSSGLAERAFYRSALTLADEGKGPEAMLKLEELVSKFPGSESARNAYRKMAKMSKDAKDFDGAAGYLAKALRPENNELNAQIQYEMAEAIEEKGDLERSAEEYMKVPKIYSKGAFWSVRAELKCAQIFEKLSRPGEAKKLYEKLAVMDAEESAFAKKRLESLK